MSISDETYEVYAFRYASLFGRQASQFFHRFDLYGEPDKAYQMDFFFWLVRSSDRTVLVDCGYDKKRALSRGLSQDNDPVELLSRLDVRAVDVDHVILSHMHFDHVGNVNLFPNATFSLARAEFDYWTGPYASRPCIAPPVETAEVRAVGNLAREERLHLVEDSELLFPGVRVTRVGGHTPGQVITEVAARSGQIVLASDAIHFYEEMESDRPFYLFSDLTEMYRTYETLRDLAARPSTTVVAGHDPSDMTRFSVVNQDCLDLTAPA